jgi:hypothetical protein
VPYSGVQDGPVDSLPSSQQGGSSDEAVSFVPAQSFGGGSDEVVVFVPAQSLGGASDQVADFIPTDSLGGASDQVADFIPTASLGGPSDEQVDLVAAQRQPPRSRAASYTSGERASIYQPNNPRSGIDLSAGGIFGLVWTPALSMTVEGVVLICTSGPGAPATPAQVSVGTIASPQLLIPTTTLTGFGATGDAWILRRLNGLAAFVAGGTPIVITIQASALSAPLVVQVRPLATQV